MIFRTLYTRLMSLFLAVLLLALTLLAVLLFQRIRDDKIEARLTMLVSQANDVAYLAARMGNRTTNEYINRKISGIMEEYEAYLLIVDRNGDILPIGDETIEFVYDYTIEEAFTLLASILQGNEIRHRSIIPDTGNPIFTVGVPYLEDGQVMGAVFIHTSEQSIEASYQDIVGGIVQAFLIALLLASLLILLACQFITRPLRAMAGAAERFARGDFEQRVAVRTKDEVGRLAASFNSMAEDLGRLEETRRQFVANVSHELRSPLTSMQGFINGILDGTVPKGEEHRYLSIVLSETKRLSKLINTLLDLSRLESGHTPLTKSIFDIREMILRIALRHEARINEQGMDMQFMLGEDSLPVRADPDRMEQVLINLIDNAVKYAGKGGIITVIARREKDLVHIAIADNGPGIQKEDIPCVFDRFYMADKAHTRGTGTGTGLGLSIVKSILDQHGQKITVSSETGKGTRFDFTLEGA